MGTSANFRDERGRDENFSPPHCDGNFAGCNAEGLGDGAIGRWGDKNPFSRDAKALRSGASVKELIGVWKLAKKHC
jgi:hypothetical protein